MSHSEHLHKFRQNWPRRLQPAFFRTGKMLIVLLLLAPLCCGCKKPNQIASTSIEIKNFSSQTIEIQQITKMKTGGGRILLKPSMISMIETDGQKIPEEFSIVWKQVGGARLQNSKISLIAIPTSKRTNKIVLEFTSDNKWIARFE